MGQHYKIQKKEVYLILGVCAISLAIGAIYDYQISSAIFNKENIFCIFLAAYGQLPVSLGLSIFGTLLIYVIKKTCTLKSVGGIIGGVLLNAMALFMLVLDPSLYFEHTTILVHLSIACILLVASNVMILRYVKDVERQEILRFIKFGLFVIIAQLIIINLIKIPWGRPRMRMIVETSQATFQPWWVIGSTMKTSLMELGVAAEEFKSFPSGHMACATSILIYSLLPMMKVQFHKYRNIIFYLGLCFAIIVGVSRIVMGAHFLSDITAGFFVTYVLFLIAYRIFYRSNKGGQVYE